ncbi:MAG: hypothetical protein C4532_14000 [Candidatus Abyssobacteria bacterium SURF_17]|uniref:Uncharacterized protein n=1 Tax=Candidatus Abyssobacteria bacterium SURF_17 TaxID=2093361 RepID=A0A419EUF4_9BACT|nr:MAG: hypothetical protein C4532_14000 [Candidatus Abyssubacteria bacterium SURF_17]
MQVAVLKRDKQGTVDGDEPSQKGAALAFWRILMGPWFLEAVLDGPDGGQNSSYAMALRRVSYLAGQKYVAILTYLC